MRDFVVPFHVVGAGVRGRLIRCSQPPEVKMRRMRYPQPAARLLAEAELLTALLGTGLKDIRRFTLHASGDGAFDALSVDCYADGLIRSYLSFDVPRLQRWTSGKHGNAPDPFLYLGKGHLAFTIDARVGQEPYQGIVALEGRSLSEAVMRYLEQSEQLNSLLRMALQTIVPAANQRVTNDDFERGYSGTALLLQKIGGTHDEGMHRVSTLLKTLDDDELGDASIDPATLLYRLFHEDGVEVYPVIPLRRGCTCSAEKMRGALLGALTQDDDDDAPIDITCKFCGTVHTFTRDQLQP